VPKALKAHKAFVALRDSKEPVEQPGPLAQQVSLVLAVRKAPLAHAEHKVLMAAKVQMVVKVHWALKGLTVAKDRKDHKEMTAALALRVLPERKAPLAQPKTVTLVTPVSTWPVVISQGST